MVNGLAVVVAAIAGMVIGAFWYSPSFFGTQWMKLSGMSKKALAKAQKKGMGKTYLAAFIAVLIMSYVLAQFIKYTKANTIAEGAVIGFWLWLGFIATTMLNSVLWEQRPRKLYYINVGHYLITLLIMGAILAVWA